MDTPSSAFAPSFDLLALPSSAISFASMPPWSKASAPRSAGAGAALEDAVHLDRGVAARVEDLAGTKLGDGEHERGRLGAGPPRVKVNSGRRRSLPRVLSPAWPAPGTRSGRDS